MKIKVVQKIKFQGSGADLFLELAGLTREDIPDEHEIWIDTKHITQIDTILPEKLSAGAFHVRMDDRTEALRVRNDYYDKLLKAWLDD